MLTAQEGRPGSEKGRASWGQHGFLCKGERGSAVSLVSGVMGKVWLASPDYTKHRTRTTTSAGPTMFFIIHLTKRLS